MAIDPRGEDWHWTDEELTAIKRGELECDSDQWTVVAEDGEWKVWKGHYELSHRLWLSPTGCYYLGDIEDEPPYSYVLARKDWSGRVWPACRPEDTDEFRRHMAAHWCDNQAHKMPDDLRDVTREQIDAMQQEIARRFDAMWFDKPSESNISVEARGTRNGIRQRG